jgi:hypothetical protein
MPVYRSGSDGTEPLRRPRLPRLGIIRLGYKETRKRPDGSEYTFPRAADHFVLDDAPSVAQIYGEQPTVLEPVFLPLDNEDIVASHNLRMYTQTWGLVCIGDGRTARRQVDPDRLRATGEAAPADKNTKRPEMRTVNCPCPYLESGDCRETLYLYVMLPKVPGVGVWQISTGSANSIRNLQGSMAMVRAIAGGITNVPLKLSLVPMRVPSFERGGPVTVHVLQLEVGAELTAYQLARGARDHSIGILPPPEESPPDDQLLGLDEEYFDPDAPPVEEWTPKQDLAQAEAQVAAPPEPEPHSGPPAADPVAAGLSPEELAQLKAERHALASLVRELVPAEDLPRLAEDLGQWFGGKSRIVELTLDELRQAGPKFRDQYGQTQESPQAPDDRSQRSELWSQIRAAARADRNARFTLHQSLAGVDPNFKVAQFDSEDPPEGLSAGDLQTARGLVTLPD